VKMDMLRLVGSETVELPILGADASGPFVFKGADGLGASDVVVQMGKTTLEKAFYQGKSTTLRQITVVVGLQPDWEEGQTPGDLRDLLYRLLTPRYNQMVRAEVWADDEQQAFAQGQISKMEPAMFTKDPAVQITLNCDYGYLLAPETVTQIPTQETVGGARKFIVENDGTAPAGFVMGVVLTDAVGTLRLANIDALGNGAKMQIEGISWAAGDRFMIDTRPGSRGVYRGAAGGALVSCLNNINATISEWPYLYAGDNELEFNFPDAFDWDTAYYFQHQAAYWGV
jgi:hypothetical protein